MNETDVSHWKRRAVVIHINAVISGLWKELVISRAGHSKLCIYFVTRGTA